MGRHAEVGYRLLSGSSSELLNVASTIAWTHHDVGRVRVPAWPRCRGDPLEGRIAAIADVFDALTTDRLYRTALPVTEAIELMRDGRGTQFDPLVLDLFFEVVEEAAAMAVDDHFDTHELEAACRSPRRRHPAVRERLPCGKVRTIDGRKFKRACRAAEHAFEAGPRADARSSRAPDARRRLRATPARQRVFAGAAASGSSQHGHHEVSDGFALEEGVLGRAGAHRDDPGRRDVRSTRSSSPHRAACCARPSSRSSRGHGDRVLNVETVHALPLGAECDLAPRGAPRRTPRGGSVISRLGCGRARPSLRPRQLAAGDQLDHRVRDANRDRPCCSSIPRSSTFAATTRLSHAWRASGVHDSQHGRSPPPC